MGACGLPKVFTKSSVLEVSTNKVGRPKAPIPAAKRDQIIEWLASGKTWREFAALHGMGEATLYRWIDKDEGFARDVQVARRIGHDALAAECLAIADAATPETVNVARLRLDARRWLLSRWSPERYGDAKASGDGAATVVVVTGVPRESNEDSVDRKSDPTGGRSPLAASRAGGEEHNFSNTHMSPNSQAAPKPRLTVEIDPPSSDDPPQKPLVE